jgi:hypothetical protein
MQIMMMTIILICLFPLMLPVVMVYFLITQYVLIAKAYIEGRNQLAAMTFQNTAA